MILTRAGFVLALAAAPVGAYENRKVAEAEDKAGALLQKGRPEDAQKVVEKLVQQLPTSPEAHLALGRLQERIGGADGLEKAAVSLAEALKLSPAGSPTRADALAAATALELRRGSGRQALAWAGEAVELQATPEHLALLARAQARTQDFDAAVETANRAVQAGPSNGAAHESLGRALLGQGRTDDAIAAFRKAFEVQPGFEQARVGLAQGLLDVGKAAEAEDEARKAAAAMPEWGEAHAVHGLAVLARDPKRWTDAIAHAQQGAFVEPSHAVVQLAVGRIFQSADDLVNAVKAFEKAATLDPGFAAPRLAVLRIRLRRGDVDGALVDAQRLAAEAPQYGEAPLLLGELLLRKDKHAEAVAPLEQAVKRLPPRAEAHYLLGRAYLGKGERHAAVPHYRRAVQLDPGNPEYRLTYGLMLGVTGEPDKGIEELERLAKTTPEKALAARINIALIYRSMNPRKLPDSVAAYLEALRLDPKNVLATLGLAIAYRFDEKWDEAIATYETALGLDAQSAAEAYTGIGDCYLKKRDPVRARAYAEKAKAAGANVSGLMARIAALEESMHPTPPPAKTADVSEVGDRLLKHNKAGARERAARDLAAYGEPAVAYLQYSLVHEPDSGVRRAVCNSLGAIGRPARGVTTYLRQIVNTIPDPNPYPTPEEIEEEGRDQDMRRACRKALERIER